MPSLRDYRDRIASVKSTRKITSAMKMVAASKLKKAQLKAEASQPYATAMSEMMSRLAQDVIIGPESPKLLVGTGQDQVQLVVVISADRGLCGGFNAYVNRRAYKLIMDLEKRGKTVKILCVGRKAHDAMRRQFADKMYESVIGVSGQTTLSFSDAKDITQFILEKFDVGEFDVCTVVYNSFKSVLTQTPTAQQLIPFSMEFRDDSTEASVNDNADGTDNTDKKTAPMSMPYRFEPSQDEIFNQLMPKNISIQVFRALLDSSAGEQAARMTAMDNATRNAGDMINNLSLQYNRARQAYITKELIEIISGAEAV